MVGRRSVNMKHMSRDDLAKDSASISEQWYEDRIRLLERENQELKAALDKETEAGEHAEEMHKGVVAELKDEIERLNDALLNAAKQVWEK